MSNINAPTMNHTSVGLTDVVSLGDLQHPQTPDEPILLHLVKIPTAPGKPRKEQYRIGGRSLPSERDRATDLRVDCGCELRRWRESAYRHRDVGRPPPVGDVLNRRAMPLLA